jgi:hypothetical protein
MHTSTGPEGTKFLHNGDYSGDVEIISPDYCLGIAFEIPFADLKFLVAQYVEREKIRRLEDATPDEILGLS